MKYFLLLFLFLSVGWLHCRSQRVAVSVNALPAIDGAFEAGVSYAIGNKSTVELEYRNKSGSRIRFYPLQAVQLRQGMRRITRQR